MAHPQSNGHASLSTASDEDFELMGDLPKEDPVIVERRRTRNNEITKKLGAYLLKGYCMLSDACQECDCILLRTPDRQLLCVGCSEVDVASGSSETTIKKETKTDHDEDEGKRRDSRVTSADTNNSKKDRVKPIQKRSKKISCTSEVDSSTADKTGYCARLESKLKWAVDELSKSQNPIRINAMCTVIIKLTESIKALKEHEHASA